MLFIHAAIILQKWQKRVYLQEGLILPQLTHKLHFEMSLIYSKEQMSFSCYQISASYILTHTVSDRKQLMEFVILCDCLYVIFALIS